MAQQAQASPEQFLAMGRQMLATQPFSVPIGAAMQLPAEPARLGINDLRAAIGEGLRARAKAVHVGRAQAVCPSVPARSSRSTATRKSSAPWPRAPLHGCRRPTPGSHTLQPPRTPSAFLP